MPSWLGIRHAQSEWNAQARVQGQADPPLSAAGRAQARALAEQLALRGDLELTGLVSSDLLRARQTAELVAARLDVPLEIEAGLRERDFGAWSGLRHAQIRERWPRDHARWRAGDPTLRPGGGESRDALARRVRDTLAALGRRHGSARLALVTHRGVLDILVPGAKPANAEPLWIPAPTPAAGSCCGGPPRRRAAPA